MAGGTSGQENIMKYIAQFGTQIVVPDELEVYKQHKTKVRELRALQNK